MRYIIIIIALLAFLLTAIAGEPEIPEKASGNNEVKPDTQDKIKVGQWVKYQIKRYRPPAARSGDKDLPSSSPGKSDVSDGLRQAGQPEDAPTALSEGEIKVSIVGKETVGDNECLWVEFSINEGKEEQRTVKLLVDKEGIPQPERLILKYGKLQPVEINLRIWEVKTRITRQTLLDEMTSGFNIVPFIRTLTPDTYDESSTTYENLPIKLPGQKESVLKCIRVLLKQTGYTIPDVMSGGQVWYSDKIPLAGLVKLLVIEDKYRTMMLLSDYGTEGAKSALTETPRKLDFREEPK